MRKILPVAFAMVVTSFCASQAQDATGAAVLERASHCNALPEGREWLECFYGAAQPARQSLGLPAAPQAQQYQQLYARPVTPAQTGDANAPGMFDIFGRKTSAAKSGMAPGDTRAQVLERAAHCETLPEARLWLDCYYGAAQPARQALGLPAASQAQQFRGLYAQTAAPVAAAPKGQQDDDTPGLFDVFTSPKVPPDQFGFPRAKPGPGVNVDRIIARIANVQTQPTGFTVTLANGQVWKQTDDKPISWTSRAATYTAIITHGAFNTFNLHLQQGKSLEDAVYKVKRVR